MKTLSSLAPGQGGRVNLALSGGMGRRLMDLGFTAGAWVDCLFSAPGDGMRAYRVRGAVIALRRADADRVLLEDEKDE